MVNVLEKYHKGIVAAEYCAQLEALEITIVESQKPSARG